MPMLPFSRLQLGGGSGSPSKPTRDASMYTTSSQRATVGSFARSPSPSITTPDRGHSRNTSTDENGSPRLLGSWRRRDGPSSSNASPNPQRGFASEAERAVSPSGHLPVAARWQGQSSTDDLSPNDAADSWSTEPGVAPNTFMGQLLTSSHEYGQREAPRGPADAYDRLVGRRPATPPDNDYYYGNQNRQDSPTFAQRGSYGPRSRPSRASRSVPELVIDRESSLTPTPEDVDGGDYGSGLSSPTTLSIPRYDARGYPIRYATPDVNSASPQSSNTSMVPRSPPRGGPTRPDSGGSYGSDQNLDSYSSSSLGGYPPLAPPKDTHVGGSGSESLRSSTVVASPTKPKSANSHRASQQSLDTTTSHSHNVHGMTSVYGPGGRAEPRAAESMYSEERFSYHTYETADRSSGSFAHDAPRVGYADFSIDSKNGRRQLVSMLADPTSWADLGPEDDDDFHDPQVHTKQTGVARSLFTVRGATNLGCVILLVTVLVVLFAGYPIITNYIGPHWTNLGGYNLGGVNASGQYPDVGVFQLVDRDTPPEAYHWTSIQTGEQWDLVFSDEFNTAGRSFYDGDDPYWMAEDLHYWSTNNLEWYDPQQITTRDGHLVITLNNQTSHGRNYTGGMMSTWNRFCFTGGYIEASISLPGTSNIYGLWPAVWTMGNLGRAGYGGTLEGMWPYSYDECDVGTLPNQTLNGKPEVALTEGDWAYDYALSYLPGQRLSRCTCPGDTNHPGPALSDGTLIGRAAPEIDVIEAQVDPDELFGEASQSAQWAPFNPWYRWINNSDTYTIFNKSATVLNKYQGSSWQQATSALTQTPQGCYTANDSCFAPYGFEYLPGADGYIHWMSNKKRSWTLHAGAMAPNADSEVGQRIIAAEPMYIIVNLGMSENFGAIDFGGLRDLWPVEMWIDYIRVYQDPNNRNIGCDPPDFPTAQYIDYLGQAYWDPNITTFDQAMEANPNVSKPRNRLVDTCS